MTNGIQRGGFRMTSISKWHPIVASSKIARQRRLLMVLMVVRSWPRVTP